MFGSGILEGLPTSSFLSCGRTRRRLKRRSAASRLAGTLFAVGGRAHVAIERMRNQREFAASFRCSAHNCTSTSVGSPLEAEMLRLSTKIGCDTLIVFDGAGAGEPS